MFKSCLFKLLKQCRCSLKVKSHTSVRGKLLVVNGTCPDGHVLMGLVAAAILFCSLTFTGISNSAKKLLNLAINVQCYRLQKEYLFPVIHTNYAMQHDAVLEFLRENDLKLSGDSRCDSPEYSAKYCT